MTDPRESQFFVRREQLSHRLLVAAAKTLCIQLVLHVIATSMYDIIQETGHHQPVHLLFDPENSKLPAWIKDLIQSAVLFLTQYESQVLSRVPDLGWVSDLIKARLVSQLGPVKAIKLLRMLCILLRLRLFQLRVFLLTSSILSVLIPFPIPGIIEIEDHLQDLVTDEQLAQQMPQIVP